MLVGALFQPRKACPDCPEMRPRGIGTCRRRATSAPRRKAGVKACVITCDSWLTDGVPLAIAYDLHTVHRAGPETTLR